ncbi:cation:proton antiporter [Clostridium sp. MD294]|uniref:cation:proton antiporter n=1 Tax=Clostridium sp. MD294 TaxID=97138 RepID=UPI0002CC1C97|nr:cation:proton antiporter [Clostridium sp. MD294]NDO45602.1 cation:proton antiporter [Clostridium sp. MD294]USF30744.1 Na(+)/H(+)-K(+) antiporter GerN [Clostridium sp. MD294]
MQSYDFLFVSAIILLSTKIFGLLSQKVHMPQVVGALTVGIILGPGCLNILAETDFLMKAAEIGVIFLMFQAGLDTEFEELKRTGKASFIIALIGVIVPFLGGTIVYLLFFRSSTITSIDLLKGCFVGVILTATSVSISVETLKEMGKLKGKIGTSILGAAIIDDILGIIVLTIITGVTSPKESSIMTVLIKILLFFIFVGICAFIIQKTLKRFPNIYPTGKRRTAIYSAAFCLIMAYCSEVYFGVADITGAYFAGLILCNSGEIRNYVARRMSIVSYMFFTPIFFASIGMKTVLSGMTSSLLLFSIVLLIVAILSKVVGCGLGAKMCGYTNSEALSVGIGMVSRGEVALIVAQKGSQAGLIAQDMFPAIIFVVIITVLLTPILLKVQMK